jgi:4-carboxymuconolactone decarboxylase
MNRLQEIPYDRMTPEQQRVHDAIVGGPRGTIRGPFLAWLANPGFADAAQKVGEYCRFNTTLPRDLAELAICVTAAHYRAEFEWWAHERMAHEAGVPEAVTDAIRRGREPRLDTVAGRAVYRTAVALNRRHRLTDAEFAEAREVLGEQGLVDVVGLCGYYALVSLTLNAFEVPVPDGGRAFE